MIATRSEDLVKRIEDLEHLFNSERDISNTLQKKIMEMDKNFQVERQSFQERIDDLTTDLCSIETQIYKMDVRLIEVEQYSRRESLVITGIPDTVSQRELEFVVINILKTIGVHIQLYDISACHSLFFLKVTLLQKQ